MALASEMTSTQRWAIFHLSQLLQGVDPESLQSIVQHVESLETPEVVAEHLQGLLGYENSVLEFISEFNARQFPPSNASVPKRIGANQLRKSSGQKPNDRQTRKPVGNVPGLLSSDLSKPKTKKKIDTLSEIDAALRDLELSASAQNKGRSSCSCQAKRHPLNTVTPNCLSCGKIICEIEGIGPCTFCNTPLLSREQIMELSTELRREAASEKQEQNKRNQSKKGTSSSLKVSYSGKAGASFASSAEFVEKEAEANAKKEALLTHVRTNAKRTIIDQASDFDSMATDKWSTTSERALALRKQQALRRAEEDHKGRVLTLNLGNGKATITNSKATRKVEITKEEVEYERKIQEERIAGRVEQEKINESYQRNKILGELGTLRYIDRNGKTKEVVEEGDDERPLLKRLGNKGWRRVQDDDEDREKLSEGLILGSRAMDGESSRQEAVEQPVALR